MKSKELFKRARFKTRRALDDLNIKKWDGENIGDRCNHVIEEGNIVDPEVDEKVFGDSFTIYTEDELQSLVDNERKKLAKRPQNDGEAVANVIVDVCVIHNSPLESGYVYGDIDDEIIMSGIRSLNDSFRNTGEHHESDGTDSFINFGPGKIEHLDGGEVWGDVWNQEGINYSGSGSGPTSGEVMEYVKKNVMDSWQDPTRYLIIAYTKLNVSGSIAGYAWVGVDAAHRIAGHFIRFSYLGHKEYLPEDYNNPFFGRTNKTAIHEVGHSFGLYHTFNNTDSCEETNPALQGDRVEDTPPHTRYNRCGTSINELPSASHMSYASHSYRRIFSPGQVERMRLVFNNRFSAMFDNPVYNWESTPVLGCTDPNAINYNPEATQDNGSCEYEILGCTDPEANNYNPEANTNDGSCTYDEPGMKTYKQGDEVLKEEYNSDEDMLIEARITFGENPEGTIFECGGSGTGVFIGFNNNGNFVARAGDGGSIENDKVARIVIQPSEFDFSSKTGLLEVEIGVDSNNIVVRFDENETGTFDLVKSKAANIEIDNWSGGNPGGVGFAQPSISGPEVTEPATFSGTIENLVTKQTIDEPNTKTYDQSDEVLKEDYNSSNDMWFDAIVTFGESPTGVIFECGGSGTGTLVGYNKDGDFVARSGDGSELVSTKVARIVIDSSEYDFRNKSGRLRYEIDVENGTNRLRFDESNTGEYNFESVGVARDGIDNWSGGDMGGIGFVQKSISGPEVTEPAIFNGDIQTLFMNNADDVTIEIPEPILPEIEVTQTDIPNYGGEAEFRVVIKKGSSVSIKVTNDDGFVEETVDVEYL